MGAVSGFVPQVEGEPTLYSAGDTGLGGTHSHPSINVGEWSPC